MIFSPVLMILGSENPYISSPARNRIGELIPTLDYKEIPGIGHIPHFEHTKEVSHFLINFISSASE
jgi:pimeloyl-ACP methyl ester carboxylesterase